MRLADNPALQAALAGGGAILPVYILDEASEGRWKPGGASRWWLHHSLASLDASLRRLGSRLLLARGDEQETLMGLARSHGVRAAYWNRCYEPGFRESEVRISRALESAGVMARSFAASLLFEPGSVLNREGGPFQVFTPFWRHCLENLETSGTPKAAPTASLPVPLEWPPSLELGSLGLLPGRSWADEFSSLWEPGEAGAGKRLRHFLSEGIDDYDTLRDIPSVDGTSGLSAHLHFGEITPRLVLAAMKRRSKNSGVFPGGKGDQRFLAELGWREFAHQLLYHFPDTPRIPLREKFTRFVWAEDPSGLQIRAWQKGLTGYPIVDAGMRQLWQQGWMHNRVRMIAASFLVKHLRLPWQLGAEWFWDTLVDADLANNTLGWQWSAGCGADAAPYFRIFNPVLQGQKFDPEGAYVRRWIPELAKLPDKWIHKPWEAPKGVLESSSIRFGETYPSPMVDHAQARKDALEAFADLKL